MMRLERPLVSLVSRAPARVQTKLLMAFLIIVVLLITLGAVGLQVLSGINQRTEQLINSERKIAAYRQVQHDTISQLYSVSSALLVADDGTIDSALRQLNQFGYDLERLQFVAKDEVNLLAMVRHDYDQFIEVVTRVVGLIRDGKVAEAREAQLKEARPLANRLERLSNELVNKAEADVVADIEASGRAYASSRAIVIAFAFGSIALALILGRTISWSLIGPIKEIDARLSQIAAGDFTQRVTVANRDELGALAGNVNRTSEQLGQLLDEIRHRQEELRITFENMGDGVAMFDDTQHLVAWNRKFQDILDVPDDIIARRQTFPEYVWYLADRGEYGPGPDADEQVRRLTEQAGQYSAYERTRPDGRVIEIRHNPVPGGGFVLIYADITDRKRNEAEIAAARDAAQEAARVIEGAYRELKTAQANLIQAEKMASLGQLTAGIAHEIKNPLNFVNNFAELSVDLLGELKDAIAPAEAALNTNQREEVDDVVATLTSNLQKITEHGKRADGIIRAMLEHSRGASGERRTVEINALADEALNLAYHGARAQDQSFNVTLERHFAAGMAPIDVNPQDMTRVFLNLFGNGFYAANKRARNGANPGFAPTLKVTTRDLGETVEIRVRDNGTGIPADIRDKLFQPFFTTKPTGEGTGLGLSITYDIVTKQHGGTISVDSKVDQFSEFVVTLPRQTFAGAGGTP